MGASLHFHVQPRVSCGCRSSSSLCQTLVTPVPTDRWRRWINEQSVAGSQGKARQGGPSSCILGGNTDRELTRHGVLLIRGMCRIPIPVSVAGAVCSTSVCQEEHGRCFRFADWSRSASLQRSKLECCRAKLRLALLLPLVSSSCLSDCTAMPHASGVCVLACLSFAGCGQVLYFIFKNCTPITLQGLHNSVCFFLLVFPGSVMNCVTYVSYIRKK